jgi:hypothetical protein
MDLSDHTGVEPFTLSNADSAYITLTHYIFMTMSNLKSKTVTVVSNVAIFPIKKA